MASDQAEESAALLKLGTVKRIFSSPFQNARWVFWLIRHVVALSGDDSVLPGRCSLPRGDRRNAYDLCRSLEQSCQGSATLN